MLREVGNREMDNEEEFSGILYKIAPHVAALCN
jgi:hypothetical protein